MTIAAIGAPSGAVGPGSPASGVPGPGTCLNAAPTPRRAGAAALALLLAASNPAAARLAQGVPNADTVRTARLSEPARPDPVPADPARRDPVQADPSGAIPVTTDTRAYCDELRERMAALHPDRDAGRLADEGAAMCSHGRVRGGVIRLRRALMLAHDPGGAARD